MEKSFTPREIDALIPKLEGIFQHMDLCQHRVQALAAANPSTAGDPGAVEIADTARIHSQIKFLLQAVQEDITLVAAHGGMVKDIGAGLVDFLGRVDGEDVWLCWKRGEPKLHFWHPLYAGFSERQTLRRSADRTITTH